MHQLPCSLLNLGRNPPNTFKTRQNLLQSKNGPGNSHLEQQKPNKTPSFTSTHNELEPLPRKHWFSLKRCATVKSIGDGSMGLFASRCHEEGLFPGSHIQLPPRNENSLCKHPEGQIQTNLDDPSVSSRVPMSHTGVEPLQELDILSRSHWLPGLMWGSEGKSLSRRTAGES